VRLESSREIGKYIQSHIPKESSILLEPIGMVGWFAKDRTFIDYPGLATPEMSRLLRDSGKKVPHRLTDPGTNAGIIHHFKPDWILLWPEEVKACQGIPEFKNEYTCETRLAYFPAEKRMDSVSVFRRIRN
jgi:hypothetical protein